VYDETEQEQHVEALERGIVRIANRTASVAVVAGSVLCAIYAYFAVAQYAWPFSLRHHAALADTGIDSLYVGELSSALAIALSTLSIVRFVHPDESRLSWKYVLNCAVLVTALQMIYWVAAGASLYVSSSLRGGRPAWGLVWWKPVPSMVMFGLAVLSIDSISKMQIDLGTMRRSQYRHKQL
jgi:hypothetical protein